MPYKQDVKVIASKLTDAQLKKSKYDTKDQLARAIFFSKERKKYLPKKERR